MQLLSWLLAVAFFYVWLTNESERVYRFVPRVKKFYAVRDFGETEKVANTLAELDTRLAILAKHTGYQNVLDGVVLVELLPGDYSPIAYT